MSQDLFGSVHVQTMKANILLAFAMNGNKAMSPSEMQSILRIPPGHYGGKPMADACMELVREGVLERVVWEGGGCRIPGWRPTRDARFQGKIPYMEASKVSTLKDLKTRDDNPLPRVLIPASRAQYRADTSHRERTDHDVEQS